MLLATWRKPGGKPKPGRNAKKARTEQSLKGWAEQWARVERWFARFGEINAGRTPNSESDYYQDEAYAFFQNAHHLKDWLKNDPSSSASARDIETVIDSSTNLSLCADLCNGSKHLKLDAPRASPDKRIGKRDFAMDMGNPPIISAKYVVESASAEYDASTLAEACMKEWKAYLTAKELL